MPTQSNSAHPTPHREVAEALVDMAHDILRLFADAGRARGLTRQQVELICAVVVRESVGMGELGRVLHVEKSNLSNLVDRLERRELLRRFRDPGDRRATRVALTDEGLRVAVAAYEEVTARVTDLLDGVPEADQPLLARMARRLTTPKPG